MIIDEKVWAIKDARVIVNMDNNDKELYMTCKITKLFITIVKRWGERIEKIIAKRVLYARLRALMCCFGMQPLPSVCDRLGLMRSLNAKFKSEAKNGPICLWPRYWQAIRAPRSCTWVANRYSTKWKKSQRLKISSTLGYPDFFCQL